MADTTYSYDNINQHCCCFNMRKVMRAVTQFYDRHLEPTGIRATQFTLLVALYTTKAKTLTDIADSLVMDRTTLTRNLKPLEKLGFITTVETLDRRSKAYALTENGREVVDKCIPLWQTAQSSITGALGNERYQNLISEINNMLSIADLAKYNNNKK